MLIPGPCLEATDGRRSRPRVFVDIRPTTLRLAMAFAIEEAGWILTPREGEGGVHVSDRLTRAPHEPPLDVLVVAPTASPSRRAVDAFSAGDVRAVVMATTPRDLPTTLALVGRGLHVLPTAVVDAAQGWPTLRPRLEQTLRLVLRGCTNRRIAATTHQSDATVKRDVAELLRLFDAPNRLALASTVNRLGYDPTMG